MSQRIGMFQPFLPIPVIPEHTRYLPAGNLVIGVGYRVLNEEIARAYLESIGMMERVEARRREAGYQRADDGGVSIFVFNEEQGELLERFRMDIFDAQPHYHYVYQQERSQERVLLDPVMTGDPQAWALWCLRERLPAVLRKVGAPELAEGVDRAAIEAVLPRVVEAIHLAQADYRRAVATA